MRFPIDIIFILSSLLIATPTTAFLGLGPSATKYAVPTSNKILARPPLLVSLYASLDEQQQQQQQQQQQEEEEKEEITAATLRSLTLCNVPKDEEPELLCDFLMEIGACSTAIIDADRGTALEHPLFGEPLTGRDDRDAWTDSLQWAAPIWNRCNVTAHFPSSVDLKDVVSMIATVFPEQYPLADHQVDRVPNKDWVIHVQQSWNPISIGPFVLRFPWHTQDDIEKAIANSTTEVGSEEKEERVELNLQGGIAFGTGEHPTTQLCLEWIHQQVRTVLKERATTRKENAEDDISIKIIDYGAGSGILGMAACALARDQITAVGIDIDVDAIQIANANARKNRVQMKSYLPPLVETADDESKSLLLKAHAHAKKQLEGRNDIESRSDLILPEELGLPIYDIGVANILAGPLVALASTMACLVRPGGRLAMSGILPHQASMVIEAYSEDFDNVKLERELGDWILVTGTRKSS